MESNVTKYEAICLRCGSALHRWEIAAQITGQTVDFIDRVCIQNTNYTLCTECNDAVKGFLKEGMKEAVRKREELAKELINLDNALQGVDQLI